MRPRQLLPLIALLVAGLLTAGFRNIAWLTGDEVMQKVKETHGADAEVDLIRMTTVSPSGDPTTHEFISAVQKNARGNFMYLLRFLSPDDEKGISLLVLEKDNGDVDQYLYVPAAKVPKKIEGSGRSGYFMGSDFTFEDMRKERPGEWKYDRLQDEKVDGTECYVILSAPADKNREKITGYTNRLVYVDKATYDVRRIEFFDSKNKLIKVFTVYDYQPSAGSIGRPRRGEMRNDTKHTTTVMTLLASRINKPLDEKFFSLDTIQNWGPEQDKLVDELRASVKPAK